MKLTRRENLRRTLRGEEPAWVPFSPNFAQWFIHHQKFGTLPAELQGCGDVVDAMKAAGCDIFTRWIDGGVRVSDTKLERLIATEHAATGDRFTTTFKTPFGDLNSVTQRIDAITSSHQEEYMVKDWSRDGDAFRCLLDQREYTWDEAAFIASDDRLGDDGIVNVSCGCTPLKFLHLTFGLDHTCLFAMDEPDTAREICDIYWKKVRPVIERLADHPRVESVILMDNVDTPFYPPSLVEQFWAPYVKDAADLLVPRGKCLFVHACGKLKALNPYFADCGLTGLEGVTHPPLGDWPADQAQGCHDRFVFNGGFSAHEQESMTDDQVRRFYDAYLPAARRRRFIFSSSCQTAVNTKWERLSLVRGIVRDWGGAPS